jgi:hypothetical protein
MNAEDNTLQVILTKLREQDPVLAASVNGLELMVSFCLNHEVIMRFQPNSHWYTRDIASPDRPEIQKPG